MATGVVPALTDSSRRRKYVLTCEVYWRFSLRSRCERAIRLFCEAIVGDGSKAAGKARGGGRTIARFVVRPADAGGRRADGPAERRTRARPRRRRVARNTAIFSIATGLSRIAGLVREIVAASYFGTAAPFSAFTIAFQVPNLVRALFADAALSAAFVPGLHRAARAQGRKREAFRLASTRCSR